MGNISGTRLVNDSIAGDAKLFGHEMTQEVNERKRLHASDYSGMKRPIFIGQATENVKDEIVIGDRTIGNGKLMSHGNISGGRLVNDSITGDAKLFGHEMTQEVNERKDSKRMAMVEVNERKRLHASDYSGMKRPIFIGQATENVKDEVVLGATNLGVAKQCTRGLMVLVESDVTN
ncbi:unnamed protein product [Ilex paraguariensis]|uniref:Uncharacterized protein n=1 Tax=Ilex paraguariensis TaxID=185542 RepID=A0ABC8SP91_9AQUA